MIWLIRLYPRRWRDRYGGELQQLVRDLGPSGFRPALALDLAKGALDAHVRQVIEMNMVQRRAIRYVSVIIAVVWLGLTLEILLSNVVFPSRTDDDAIPVVVSYLCVFAAIFLAGHRTARAGVGPMGYVAAGVFTGMMIGLLTTASFAIVDNVWLDIVAQQPTKIEGFAHSGAASMRDYVNHSLASVAVGLPLGLGFFGAILGWAGGFAGRGLAPSSHNSAGPANSA
jgi:hypothetical protein